VGGHPSRWTRFAHAQPYRPAIHSNYAVFEKVKRPDHSLDGWLALLEQALPPHLRLDTSSTSNIELDSTDTTQIILSAQYPQDSTIPGVDLLHHLGVVQGRWVALMWLVKELTEEYHEYTERSTRLARLAQQLHLPGSLDDLTLHPIELSTHADEAPCRPEYFTQFDEFCYVEAKDYTTANRLRHAAVGQIWRSIGRMTQACAGDAIAPEILEVIAHLHHTEIMPASIYEFEPNAHDLAIRAPPLLSFLSSRILTSLSDAAWRGHEKLIIEEAKAKGDAYSAMRPEMASSSYRVRVAGLKTEVWMELILWACLRGGWVQEGAQILLSLSADKSWKPISWQEHEAKFSSETAKASVPEWNAWDFQFKTRSPDSVDAPIAADFHVDRTVSGEVISAFADALVSLADVGVGNRGIPVRTIVATLRELQKFLNRSKLSLPTGSWDALLIRLADGLNVDPTLDAAVIQDLVMLSPGMSRRLPSTVKQMKTNALPGYILDGNLAIQGLLHTALKGQISSGHFESALQVFTTILERADEDKREAITSFMRKRKSLMDTAIRKGHFTSNFEGIDYPALNVNIPPHLLAALLDLATEARNFDFGNWLVASEDVDGPLITPGMYGDSDIQRALINFALESSNDKLLETIIKQTRSTVDMRAFLDGRINALQWRAATTLLDTLLKSGRHEIWGAGNLANLGRVVVSLAAQVKDGDVRAENDLIKAKELFTAMVQFKYDLPGIRSTGRIREVQSIIAVLSTVTKRMGKFCLSLAPPPRRLRFNMTSSNFNLMLEGIVDTHGSVAGRRVLATFWPWQARLPQNNQTAFGTRQITNMQVERPRALQRLLSHTYQITIGAQPAGPPVRRPTGKSTAIQGTVIPNTRTILIILQRALEELQEQSLNPKPPSAGSSPGPASDSTSTQSTTAPPRAVPSKTSPSPPAKSLLSLPKPSPRSHLFADPRDDEDLSTDPDSPLDIPDPSAEDDPALTTAEIGAGIAADEGRPTIDISARGMVAWAVRHLAELPSVEENLVQRLDLVLQQYGMDEARADLKRIVRQVQRFLDEAGEEKEEENGEREDGDALTELAAALAQKPITAADRDRFVG
jgi:hypothetical protein